MPAAMIAATAPPARSTSSKAASSRLRARGPGQQPHRDLDNDPEHALRAGQQRQQVVTGGIEAGAADGEALAIHGDDLQREDVVHRETVLQAMHATGILGHVAPDGAGDLRRGIGRVVQPQVLHRLRDREVAHAGLHARGARQRVDLQDAVEFREAEQHTVGERQRPARQSGARPARDHRHAARAAQAQHRLHLPDGIGQYHHERPTPVRRQTVALVGRQFLVTRQHRGRRQQRPERAQQGVAIHACLRAGLGNSHHRSSIRPVLRHASKCRRARVARHPPHRRGFTGCRDSSKQGMRLPPGGA